MAHPIQKESLFGICGNIDHNVKTVFTDKKGRILILEISIKNEHYILVNLYNENKEKY